MILFCVCVFIVCFARIFLGEIDLDHGIMQMLGQDQNIILVSFCRG